MRNLIVVPGLLLLSALSFGTVAAQEIGETVSLTGCLAQEADGEGVEYLLEGVTDEETSAAVIELVAGEGVSLEPHVGHTVEATGVVIGDDDDDEEEGEEEQEGEEEEAEDEDEDHLHIRVTVLGHIAASCEAGP